MIIRRRYDQVQVGDYIRPDDWPVFHKVERVNRSVGLVLIDMGVGGMIEKLPPRPGHELIEMDRED